MARLNNNNEDIFALRDYHHAAKTFTSEPGYTKTPYSGFLFHVNISFNSVSTGASINTKNISVLVKAADLPEIQFETETLNQYNRKRIVNKRVIYQPIKLEFHDDVANNVRNMWIGYNQHYSADATYTSENTWQLDNVYQNEGISRRYGLDNGASVPFINKIEIYSMGNQTYSKMLLVNPVINSAAFGDHEYSDGAKVMQTTLTIEYENIIYSSGSTDQIPGFGSDNIGNYDQNNSTLGLFETENLSTTKPSKPNTPITSTLLSNSEVRARQLDSTPGRVSKKSSFGQTADMNVTEFTESRYQTLKRDIVNTYSAVQQQFTFPDTSIQSLSQATVSTGIPNYNSSVMRSNAISSNGQNVAMLSSSTGVSTTPISYADNSDLPLIMVSPIVPDNLTSAEQSLFQQSYPPLPSTDPRAALPPYV